MKEVTVQELKQMKEQGDDFQLIDCREPNEFQTGNLDGELIPLGDILISSDKISRDKKVIIHCRSGARSANAVLQLEGAYQYENLYNLKGGIKAWSEEIDPTISY